MKETSRQIFHETPVTLTLTATPRSFSLNSHLVLTSQVVGTMKIVQMWLYALVLCGLLLLGCSQASAPVATFRGGAEKQSPLQLFTKTILDARRHLAAAGVARCISIFAMYPVDTIKTRMQMEQANPLRLAGMYKGVAGSLFGQVPYG